MKTYHLKRTQFLPISPEEAWNFFSSPKNLGTITPAHMKFMISYNSGRDRIVEGQVIGYKINILPAIPVQWVTKITVVREPMDFVDEQHSGPFRLWQHRHSFRKANGGIDMTDEVKYALPLGWIGFLAHWIFVKRKLNAIFDYRFEVLSRIFNKKEPDQGSLPG